MNPIAYLFTIAESSGWHPIIPAFIIAFPIACLFAIFLFWLAQKDNKKYISFLEEREQETNPKNAKWFRHYDCTPPEGSKAIVLSEDRWVVVQWDREKDMIVIITPPEHRDRKYIPREWINAKFEEAQKVRIEDLPRIS